MFDNGKFPTIFVGVAVGGGWQAIVAYINLACYYIFGLPLGYILGYVADFGVTVLKSSFRLHLWALSWL